METEEPPSSPAPAAELPGGPPPAASEQPVGPRWHPLVRVVLYIVLWLLVQGSVGLGIALLARLEVPGAEWLVRGVDALRPLPFLLVYGLMAALLVLLTIPFVRFLDRSTLAKLGARWPEGGKPRALRQAVTAPLGTMALLGAWMVGMAAVAELRLGGLSDGFARGTSGWPGPGGGIAALVVYLLAFLIQGGFEEWVVRGYIYHALKERWRWWVAALASSVLFSALHADNPNVSWVALVNIVLAGFILAELVERSGSLWSAVVAHGVWNFVVACVLSLPVSGIRVFHLLDLSIEGPPLLTGGEFGPEGSLVATFLGLVLAGLLWPRGDGGSEG